MIDCSIEPLAEDALLLRFGAGIDAETNARVHAAANALRSADLPGISEIAPAYATLLVRFDPFSWCKGNDALLKTIIEQLDPGLRRGDEPGGDSRVTATHTIVDIPVWYGDEFGPDIDSVAAHAGITTDEVVARHAGAEYSVAMLGFAPGFPYLLGLDPVLHVPRRAMPRTRVPAGSVAIGGPQTGIYPRELPGGWHLIGCTPLKLFDPQRDQPCSLAPGDRVRFRAIDADEYVHLATS